MPIDIAPDDILGIVQFVGDNRIDLVYSGPENPYALGLVDQLTESFKNKPKDRRPLVFGPTQAAARIESSKVWSAGFNWRHNIPQPGYITSDWSNVVKEQIDRTGWSGFAVKADELDGGKGVVVCNSAEEAYKAVDDFMVERIHGVNVGNRVVVQEKLVGQELSIMAWVDKKGNYAVFPPSVDYKALNGKNTGGMGVYAPYPLADADWDIINSQILRRAIDGMRDEGCPFMGILYAGLMLTDDGPKVLEWNCRGGDPEIEATLPLYQKFDLVDAIVSCVQGTINKQRNFNSWAFSNHNTTVILASEGYPDSPKTEREVRGLELLKNPGIEFFHGGTKAIGEKVLTSGGRVLAISATANSPEESRRLAYSMVGPVNFDGMQYLKGIRAT